MCVIVMWVQSVYGAGKEEQRARRCCIQAFRTRGTQSWISNPPSFSWAEFLLHCDFSSTLSFWDHVGGAKETLDVPLESFLDLVLPLRNEEPLISTLTLHQRSPDRILVLHQAERFGPWHTGIWLLIYLLSLCAANGILQLVAHTHTHTPFIKSLSSIDLRPSCCF